jgi:hypothetical protein
MVTVLGVFSDQARALELIESLRSQRIDTTKIRLISGPDDIQDFAARAGPGANVAAGPAGAVVGGLVESDLSEQQLKTIQERVEAGALVVLAEDLDDDDAARLEEQLRQRAENVVRTDRGPAQTDDR